MDQQMMWIVACIGALTMVGVFLRMKGGFGPINFKIVGLVLVATFATLLGMTEKTMTPAIGILGAIAGYFLA